MDQRGKLKQQVQPYVAEPVVAVAMLHPAGTMTSAFVGGLVPVAGLAMAASNTAGGIAHSNVFHNTMALLALTEHYLYAFTAKPFGKKVTLKEQAGAWWRTDVDVAITPGRKATRVDIAVRSTGQRIALEATKVWTKDFNDEFLHFVQDPIG